MPRLIFNRNSTIGQVPKRGELPECLVDLEIVDEAILGRRYGNDLLVRRLDEWAAPVNRVAACGSCGAVTVGVYCSEQ